ncbi:MAG: hypothetical protein QXZ17_13635 [Nitrososphaerota archaeon]
MKIDIVAVKAIANMDPNERFKEVKIPSRNNMRKIIKDAIIRGKRTIFLGMGLSVISLASFACINTSKKLLGLSQLVPIGIDVLNM